MGSPIFSSEFMVRTPAYLAYESQLRHAIPDKETRFRVAGELLCYTENSPRRKPKERLRFRTELESTLGKAKSDRLILTARQVYNGYRLIRYAVLVIWVILFLLGAWGMCGLFVDWGWNPYASLLAAGFVVGAIFGLGTWILTGLLSHSWRRL